MAEGGSSRQQAASRARALSSGSRHEEGRREEVEASFSVPMRPT